MHRRRFLTVVAAGGATLALPACDGMPASAIAAWQGPRNDLPDLRLRLLSWALLAPNPHNMQPWLADLREAGTITLALDPQRLLPVTDPPGRQILIGCGAFIELLRMAAAQEGQRAQIELFPQGEPRPDMLDTRPVARVRLTRDAAVARDPLFDFVRERRTNRSPYEARVPDGALLKSLPEAVSTPGIETTVVTDAARVAALSAIAADGYRLEFATPAAFAESARVVRIGAEEIAAEPSGIAVHGAVIWWARKLGLMKRDDVFDPNSSGARRVTDTFVNAMAATPVWVYQSSRDDRRVTQLDAGRAYLRLALAGTRAGLAVHPNSQTLQEYPEMAALYARVHAELQVTAPARMQMLARVGYAPAVGPAPRRVVERLVKA